MVEIETRFGKCNVEKTKVDYQLIAYFSKVDKEDMNKLKDYFENFGKFEKIVIGASFLLNHLGISNTQNTSELTYDDFGKPEVMVDTEKDFIGRVGVLIKSIIPTTEEKKYGFKRLTLEPRIIANMIENIEKYEALKETRMALKDLKD